MALLQAIDDAGEIFTLAKLLGKLPQIAGSRLGTAVRHNYSLDGGPRNGKPRLDGLASAARIGLSGSPEAWQDEHEDCK